MKKGLILILLSALMFVGFTSQSQVIFSSDFENWTNNLPNGWMGPSSNISADSIVKYTSNPHSGSSACRLINRGTTSALKKIFSSQSIIMDSYTKYKVSYWFKGQGSITPKIKSGFYQISSQFNPNNSTNYSTWTKFSFEFETRNIFGNHELVFEIFNTKALSEDVQIDDIEIVKIRKIAGILNVNDINAGLFEREVLNGKLFYNALKPSFEVPKGSGKHTIYTSSLWIGGKNTIDDSLHLSVTSNSTLGYHFSGGPIALQYDSIYKYKYQRLWNLTKLDIEYHKNNFYLPNYVMNKDIAEWPAHGNVANGEAANLAPYVDVNQNNIYDPQNGDYPKIKGDQTVFFILNDNAQIHLEPKSKPLKIDIFCTLYSFANTGDSSLNQTVFANYELHNRSTNNYKEVYLGNITDFDIGYSNDDYVGYDSLQNMSYGYNGHTNDGTFGEISHYFSKPPAQGVKVLNHSVSKFTTKYYPDGVIIIPDIETDLDYYKRLKGVFFNGTPLTYGGNGYNTSSTAFCNYMFTGYPEDSIGWNEYSLKNAPGDRNGLLSIGPKDLNAGAKITLDLAFIFARDYTGNNLSSVALLRQRAQAIQNHYNNGIGIEDVKSKNIDIARIYPNPNKGNFNIVLSQKPDNSVIFIYNLQGKLITSKKLNTEFSTIDMQENKGMYIYLIKSKNEIIDKGKLIIE